MTGYIELHAHSNFSLLDGASPPEALVARAAELEMDTLALTDHNAVYGAVRFVQAARVQGIRPILGAELALSPGYHLTLLVKDKSGWENLCHLISLAQYNAAKGEAALPPEQLADHAAGLIVLSGCKRGEIAAHLLRKEPEAALAAACRYRELFGPDNFWIELQHHLLPEDETLVAELVALAQHLGLGYVATNNVHYARRTDRRLQDILVCIRHQLRLAEAGPYLHPNSEFYLKPAQRLVPLFFAYPQALRSTRCIAERCQFELHYGLQDLPEFPTPNGLSAAAYLKQLCQAAAQVRYPELPSRVQEQLTYELTIIEQANLANYFLIVWDIVHFARAQGIRCQGRGSAANSLVAYLLHISPIDPLTHDLVFERFLSPERQGTPDIDLDFEAQRREEVIQYLYRRYGAAHTAMACTFVTFHTRSALRDSSKVLDLSPQVMATALQRLEVEASFDGKMEQAPVQLLLELCRQIHHFPRHLGIHNGGMVMMGAPLAQRLPTDQPRCRAGWSSSGTKRR